MSPRDIERWYPQRWDEIAGNSRIVRAFWHFLIHGMCNALFTGPSRTGKTRTISLGIKALLCPKLDDNNNNPCGNCPTCNQFGEGLFAHDGLYSAVADSRYEYYPIDCESITAEELRKFARQPFLQHENVIVYLDEVAALGRRGLEGLLFTPTERTRCTWFASAISVAKKPARGKGKEPFSGEIARVSGLSPPILNRFAKKEATALPSAAELYPWIIARCLAWKISIVEPEVTVPLLIKRTHNRVGHIVNFLQPSILAPLGRAMLRNSTSLHSK